MFRLWKVAYGPFGVAPILCDAPDADSGGGEDLDGAGSDGFESDEGAGPDDSDPEARADGADADREQDLEDLVVDDDDDDQGRNRPPEEQIRALTKKNRKQRKQLAKLLPMVKRLQGVDLDDLTTRARNYDRLDHQIRTNPKLRAALYGDDDDANRTSRSAAAASREDEFDETSLPFDPNESPTNRYFADMAKRNHALEKELKRLASRLDGVDGRDQQRTEREEGREWKSAIDAAAGRIKFESVREQFKDAMAGAYKVRRQYGLTPQTVIDRYIKKLEKDGLLSAQEAAKANAAAAQAGTKGGTNTNTAAQRQRIAEQNRQLPRTVAPTGQPTAARTGKEKLSDVHKRLRTTFSAAAR